MPERANANRRDGGILVQTGIGQSFAAVVGSIGNRCEANNLVEPRGLQPTLGKSSLAHRADGSSLVDVQARKRLAAIERLFPDGTDGHAGEADIGEIRAVIEGVQSNFRNGAVLKAHCAQIGGVGAELCVNFIHPVIDNQIRYHPTVDGVLARVVLINLYRYISVCIARIQVVVRHELGILVDRWLVREGIDFAVVGRGLRRCRRGLCCIGIGRGARKVLGQARRGSAGIRAGRFVLSVIRLVGSCG